MTDDWFIRSCYHIVDAWFAAIQRRGLSQGLANYLLVTRRAFESVDGFREDVDAAEDVDFVRRVAEVGVARYERSIPVLVSPRRFRTENALVFAMKSAMWGALRLVGSTKSIIGYRWQGHNADLAQIEECWLRRHGYSNGLS
jgi:hypothetical protein